jgi:hypothetical protein
MDQVLVDVHHTWAIFNLFNYVGVPDFIEYRFTSQFLRILKISQNGQQNYEVLAE